MGSKSRRKREQTIRLNRIVIGKLRDLGVPYKDMRQATAAVAASMGISTALGWRDLRKLIVEKATGKPAARNRNRPDNVISIYRPSEEEIRLFYDSWDWKHLSYDIKLKRGRRCECCGAKAPEVRIVTDHIKPLRFYWHLRLDPTNLQVLCDDCNRGKASRDITDFRVTSASS